MTNTNLNLMFYDFNSSQTTAKKEVMSSYGFW